MRLLQAHRCRTRDFVFVRPTQAALPVLAQERHASGTHARSYTNLGTLLLDEFECEVRVQVLDAVRRWNTMRPLCYRIAAVLPHSGRSLQAWGFIGASRVGSGASFLYTAGVRMNVVTSGTIGNPHDPPGTASLCQTNSEWIGAHVPNTCAVTVAMPVFAPQAICPLENS